MFCVSGQSVTIVSTATDHLTRSVAEVANFAEFCQNHGHGEDRSVAFERTGTGQIHFLFRVRRVFLCGACVQDGKARHSVSIRVQELCESRGGRPGLSVLTSLTVSVDVKQH